MKNTLQDNITPVLLAGGLGTRLKDHLPGVPKVLAPVCNKPFLIHLIEQLEISGFQEVIICTGYRGEMVQSVISDQNCNMKISFSHEDTPLGTGGALRNAISKLDSPHTLVMNGDSYVDTDLLSFCDWHLENQHQASLMLVEVENASRFGSVETDKNQNIITFKEKTGSDTPGIINSGIYIFRNTLLESIPTNQNYSLENDFFPALTKGLLKGLLCNGRFIDIGIPESYEQAESFFKTRRIVR
jgi:D-glycero-alpha-D-manno-heptose 1-phosphate guanylyltransferase